MRRIPALLICAAVLAALPAFAADLPAKLDRRVNDFAGVLDPASAAAIERTLAAEEAKSSNQIVVAIVPSLDGDSIDDRANRLFERWGLGQKGKDNGILLLISMADRKARIEVGYGLEGRLTDALSRRILEDRLFPAFRKKAYARGIADTCAGISEAIQGAYVASPRRNRSKATSLAFVLFLALVGIIVLVGLQGGGGIGRGGRRRYYRSGPIWWGGSGGGFGGFSGGGGGFGGFSGGGGLSGGGGASGSW